MRTKHLTDTQKAYIAGFLDGDGSIFIQIVHRKDYRLKFQIRFSIVFFQKTEKEWFLLKLKKFLLHGSIRDRNDGMSEYAIVGLEQTVSVLHILSPYLSLKRKLATLLFEIAQKVRKIQTLEDLLHVCELVDTSARFTYSKKRTVTTDTVRKAHQHSGAVQTES